MHTTDKKLRYLLPIGLMLILSNCDNTAQNQARKDQDTLDMLTEKHAETVLTEVPFAIAQNYFVRNDAPPAQNPKITSQEEFDRIFGQATLMGEQGKPTPIDFAQQFVIAIVLDPSDLALSVEPMDLQKNEHGELQFRYTVVVGEKEQHTSQSALILVVDKQYEASVLLDRVDN